MNNQEITQNVEKKLIRGVVLNDSIVLKGFIDTGSFMCTIKYNVLKKFNLPMENFK